jgi:hypothetical protein
MEQYKPDFWLDQPSQIAGLASLAAPALRTV